MHKKYALRNVNDLTPYKIGKSITNFEILPQWSIESAYFYIVSNTIVD